MTIVPLSRQANEGEIGPSAPEAETGSWIRVATAGTLIASGLLLLNGKRRAGLFMAASATALTKLDQQDTLRAWWKTLPGYIDEVQVMLGRVQGAVDTFKAQREKLGRFLPRQRRA